MDLIISAGQVLTGHGEKPITDGAVLVRGNAIAAVGSRAEVEKAAPGETTTLSYPDATLMPGLINCHVHLAFDAGPDPVTALRGADDADVLLGMTGRARQLLDCGVTTARDLGDRGGLALRLRDAIDSGIVPGPRILAATAPLTTPGGHCWFLGGEVDGEQAIRDLVRHNAARGADVIKVMAGGGQMTPSGARMWESQFDLDGLRVVVEEARRVGLPVAAHAHGTEAIAAATTAGVQTIEHCTWLAEGGRFEPRPEVAAEMATKGIAVCPTTSPNWREFVRYVGEERAAQLHGRLRWLYEQGIRLVAGTDAGLPGSVFDDFVSSLELYEHLGFDLDRIIGMATAHAADALGLAHRTGRVAAGLDADLLVVDGDPLTNLDALRRIAIVLARGRAHVPANAVMVGHADHLSRPNPRP